MAENENAEEGAQGSEATEQTEQKTEVTEDASKESTEAAPQEAKPLAAIYKMDEQGKEATEEKEKVTEEKEKVTEEKKEEEPVEFNDFEIPEGFNVNEPQMESFKELLAELAKKPLDKDGAQKLINFEADARKQDAAAYEAQITKQRGEWDKEIKADVEYGGANLNSTMESGNLALRSVNSGEAFGKYLKDLGVEKNPCVIKYMADIGKQLDEDQIIDGKAPNAVDARTKLDKRYPTMPD